MEYSRIDFGHLTVFFVTFTAFAGISIMAPFFPSEAAKKGVSVSLAGAVFSANAVGQFLMSSISGKILPLIGSRIAFVVGLVILGLSNLAFGLLHHVYDYTVYVTQCFVFRITEACGSALINTTVYMVFIKKCRSNDLAFIIAVSEACSAIGLAIGPAIGSFLYSIGGFELPFIVIGCVVLINIPITLLLLENYKDLRREQQINKEVGEMDKLTYLKLLSIPKVLVALIALFTFGLSLGSLSSVLELYLQHYEVGPELVGYIFLFATGSFTVVSIIIGNFFTNINHFKCMSFGLSLCAFGYLLIAPSPFFFIQGKIIIVAIALCFIGSGNAFTFIPTLPSIMKTIKAVGYTDSVHNSSCVSGLWTAFYTLGLAIGYAFGAVMYEYFGAQLLFTVLSMFCFTSVIILLLSFLKCFEATQYIKI